MRSGGSHDYPYFQTRTYFPLSFSEKWIDEIRAELPEYRKPKPKRYQAEYALWAYDAPPHRHP